MQDRLIFYPNMPSRELTASPADIGLEYDSVFITTDDQLSLHGWFVPAIEGKGVLLFFHGNAGNISHRLDSLRIFHGIGLSTLIIDYRGYGKSEGKVSEQGTYFDAQAAWKYLTEKRGVSAEKIIVFGRSLGAAIAAYSSAENTPGGLILESAFTSVPDMAAKLYPIFPVRLLSRYDYNTRGYIGSIKCPVLIIHSPTDEIIPYENGRKLYDAASEPKSFLEIYGSHNEGFLLSGKKYTKGLKEFTEQALALHKGFE
jgi:fermentation-respiration switch protein FrsA (DUF1100 family)